MGVEGAEGAESYTRRHETDRVLALVAALAECDTVITPMTDVPHLAAAVGRPVVALCGAVNVQRWRPVGVPYELARAPGGALADVTVDHAFAACEVLATRVSMLGAG